MNSVFLKKTKEIMTFNIAMTESWSQYCILPATSNLSRRRDATDSFTGIFSIFCLQ